MKVVLFSDLTSLSLSLLNLAQHLSTSECDWELTPISVRHRRAVALWRSRLTTSIFLDQLIVDGLRPIASTVPYVEPIPLTGVSVLYLRATACQCSARGSMHVQTTTATMAYSTVPLPASPTLTNPDMILPYGEYDSTPSPPRGTYRSGSPNNDWETDPATMQFSIGSAHSHMGLMTPTTPILYGNGTMLSDIGEVTEAESTPGRKLPGPAERRLLKQQQLHNSNQPLRSSPTIGYQAVMKRAKTGTHQRSVSIESTSTVTSEAQQAELFKDFDDTASVDDSVFQGDDEESVVDSVADSYTEEVIASETKRLNQPDSNIGKDEDGNSSAALSRRAEQILLNAKKRLNVRFWSTFIKTIEANLKSEHGGQSHQSTKLTIYYTDWVYVFYPQQQSFVSIYSISPSE